MIRHYLVTVEVEDDPSQSPAEQLDASAAVHKATGAHLAASTFQAVAADAVVRRVLVDPATAARRCADHWVSRAIGQWTVEP
jgi:hypothetical protein